MMFRKLDPDAIARLNDPNQGMSYKGRDSGHRKYDPDTGNPYYTPSRPATLTIYGERAETVMAIIEHCQEVAAALTPSALSGDAGEETDGFEAECDDDTYTIRFPDGHALTAWADGRLFISNATAGFAPFETNVAALAHPAQAHDEEAEKLIEQMAEALQIASLELRDIAIGAQPKEGAVAARYIDEALSKYAALSSDKGEER